MIAHLEAWPVHMERTVKKKNLQIYGVNLDSGRDASEEGEGGLLFVLPENLSCIICPLGFLRATKPSRSLLLPSWVGFLHCGE